MLTWELKVIENGSMTFSKRFSNGKRQGGFSPEHSASAAGTGTHQRLRIAP